MAIHSTSPVDPVAIVTAASKGMGRAIAQELAARGYALALLARSDSVRALALELGGIHVKGSVASPDDLATLVETTLSTYGKFDAVVNNTGHPPRGDLLSIRHDEWHQALDLVVLNVIRMCRLVVPEMIKQRRGVILNISTIGAVQPDVAHPVSAVLRGGVSAFSKLFVAQYAQHGLRMNSILPGRIESYHSEWGSHRRNTRKAPRRCGRDRESRCISPV